MGLLTSLENSGFSTWVREGLGFWAYDIFLVSHALGMAALVGISAGVALRLLGFAPTLPLKPLKQFFPLMWAGFWVNLASGVVLFVTYPVRAVINPVFYIKMAGVAFALLYIRRIYREVFTHPVKAGTNTVAAGVKTLAGYLLLIWVVTITAGRLMAYHNTGAGVEWKTPLAMLIATAVMVLGGYIAWHRVTEESS